LLKVAPRHEGFNRRPDPDDEKALDHAARGMSQGLKSATSSIQARESNSSPAESSSWTAHFLHHAIRRVAVGSVPLDEYVLHVGTAAFGAAATAATAAIAAVFAAVAATLFAEHAKERAVACTPAIVFAHLVVDDLRVLLRLSDADLLGANLRTCLRACLRTWQRGDRLGGN